MEQVPNLNEQTIKLVGKDIDNRSFNMVFNKLCQHAFADPKIAYNISYIAKKVQSFTKDIMMEHGKLLDKYAQKDAEGNFDLDEHKNVQVPDDKKNDYKKDLDSVHEIELEIRKKKLDVNVLSQNGFAFAANDISVLEPLLCGLED